MNLGRVQVVKLALALGGIALFGIGIRVDQFALRWAGIGLVAVAWVLRFARPPR